MENDGFGGGWQKWYFPARIDNENGTQQWLRVSNRSHLMADALARTLTHPMQNSPPSLSTPALFLPWFDAQSNSFWQVVYVVLSSPECGEVCLVWGSSSILGSEVVVSHPWMAGCRRHLGVSWKCDSGHSSWPLTMMQFGEIGCSTCGSSKWLYLCFGSSPPPLSSYDMWGV